MRDRRVRVLAMSPRFLLRLLAVGEHPPYRVIQDAIPGDAEIVACEHTWNGAVRFYIWSATFDVVPEGEEPPYLTPTEQSIETWPTPEHARRTEQELDRIQATKAVSHA